MKKARTNGPLSHRERDRVRGSDPHSKRARLLRRQSTDAEKFLWHYLRDRRLGGFKFRRQVPIEPYIVDFLCLESRLIIEVDGGQHDEQQQYDLQRTGYLANKGYRVIRFWNNQVLNDTDEVLEKIRTVLIDTPSP